MQEPSDDAERRRGEMVDAEIAGRGVRDARVLAAMRRVPREAFVAAHLREDAYDDGPLPIAAGQTISQPYIVARMLEAAAIAPTDRVLEIGAGSGYACAAMSLLAESVDAVERHAELADSARGRLARLGYANVAVHCGDGSVGWPDAAPFDAIVVSAAGPAVPAVLRDQLAIGGRLVMPVGGCDDAQYLVRVVRRSATEFDSVTLDAVRFVPLIGAAGWARTEGA